MSSEIIIVSGLPRSGTSLMMQMLASGGVEIVTDHIRQADTDNPKGYFELEQVKTIERDTSWLSATRGKAFKMVSQLLYHLPATETYRIIFMQRDLDEVLLSQEKMLTRLGRTPPPRESIRRAFTVHLERLYDWLPQQGNMTVLCVPFHDLVEQPTTQAGRLRDFLGGRVEIGPMVQAVDPSLHRNRSDVMAHRSVFAPQGFGSAHAPEHP
jgi:hypothetical protein